VSRLTPSRVLLVLVAIAAALTLAACGDDDSSSGDEAAGDAADTFQTPTGITCSRAEPDSRGNGKTYDAPPELTIEEGVTYTATLATSCGDIVLELDAVSAPITTNNFVFLARDGFYDGLTFHRTVPGFVIQGGDPAGDGTGGPGYRFEDELPTDGYPQGSLAMANAGPSTNGSQFFIVTGQADLPNDFSRFGRVTQGLEVAQGIESLGDAGQQPSETVYIDSVTITES
jgi:cyclophilin family peptidyl-prolyl cis-trans isomerase